MFTNRFFTTLFLVALAAVIGLTVRDAVLASAVGSELTETERIQQTLAADMARWEAMGEYYANQAPAQPMDSGTRSYIAWGEALEKAKLNALDSGTRSYIAWGEALQAAGKLDVSGTCPNMTQENIFAGIPNNVDSATRSYIAWGLALQAKNDIEALCR